MSCLRKQCQSEKIIKIQTFKKHVRILKIMETLVDMIFSIVIMTLSDYCPDCTKKYKNILKSSCESSYSIVLTMATYYLETRTCLLKH